MIPFLYRNWPKIGAVLLFPIFIYLLLISPRTDFIIWLFWLHLPILMAHQTEEYVFPGGFKKYANSIISKRNKDITLSDEFTFYVNVPAWLIVTVAAIIGRSAIEVPLMVVIAMGVNALFHSILPLKLKQYNPGFFTSLFVIIPYAVFVTSQVYSANLLSVSGIIVSIIGGILLMALLPLSIFAKHRKLRR